MSLENTRGKKGGNRSLPAMQVKEDASVWYDAEMKPEERLRDKNDLTLVTS